MKEVFGHLDIDDSFELPTTEAFNASVVPRNQRVFRMFTTVNPVMRKACAIAPTVSGHSRCEPATGSSVTPNRGSMSTCMRSCDRSIGTTPSPCKSSSVEI